MARVTARRYKEQVASAGGVFVLAPSTVSRLPVLGAGTAMFRTAERFLR